jgi:hypothetical protein
MGYINTHIIRYAKNHYGHSVDRISDLKVLISKWSGTDEEYISEREVMECVYNVWCNIQVSRFDREALMREMFYTSHHRTTENDVCRVSDAIKILLGGMSPIAIKDLPELEEKYSDINFTPIDERI